MRKPNFFIVGAPKCGTSALYEYLRTHPQVYVSTPKEPHYFDDDFADRLRSPDDNAYLARYFASANRTHKAIGEASPSYLYSRNAIPRIKKFNPQARLIVMLRNPAEVAYALHSEHCYFFKEDEKDFEKAWRLQHMRRAGQRIPKMCDAPSFLQYKDYVSFGSQLERVYTEFPWEQVKVIFLDDLRNHPVPVYRGVLRFLDLAPDGRCDFPVVNANRRHRVEWVSKILSRLPLQLIKSARAAKKILGLEEVSLVGFVNQVNRVQVRRAPLAENMRREILAAVEADIQLLETLTGRDLSCWKAAIPEAERQNTEHLAALNSASLSRQNSPTVLLPWRAEHLRPTVPEQLPREEARPS